ncbi:hypothetical protein J31TS4_22550 [Paenibacillus sp. J31TS4]|uniref:DUF6199 family natural product biosynthesis protein n=1 Tax=Paenibacillus sp. J31TS4 TaxID=2807195 RepID=UPI001B288506|nr:DUF6199 family natural product biosynthesis protein [Paenibacillus sp. J31TS4]GIP38975.1 hypothetical protein J31TS4_22550 [Paenibacillus sp. J31TS4]
MGLISVLLVAAGVLMLSRPDWVWSVTESWKSGDATEPSDTYILSTRFGGGMVTLAGLGGIVAAWVL